MKKHVNSFKEFSLNEGSDPSSKPEWFDHYYLRSTLDDLDGMLKNINVNGWVYDPLNYSQVGFLSFHSDQMPMMEIAITPFWEHSNEISAQINCFGGYYVNVETNTKNLTDLMNGDIDDGHDAGILFGMIKNILYDLTKDDCAEAGKVLANGDGDIDLGSLFLDCMTEEDGIVIAALIVESGADPMKEFEKSGLDQSEYERFMEWFKVEKMNYRRSKKAKRLFGI